VKKFPSKKETLWLNLQEKISRISYSCDCNRGQMINKRSVYTKYGSVVLLGKNHIAGDLQQTKHVVKVLLNYFEDDSGKVRELSLKSDVANDEVAILAQHIIGITGKQGQ